MCTDHRNNKINHLSIQSRKRLSRDWQPGYCWHAANKPHPPLMTLMARWRHFTPHLNMDKWRNCWFLNFVDEAWKTRASCTWKLQANDHKLLFFKHIEGWKTNMHAAFSRGDWGTSYRGGRYIDHPLAIMIFTTPYHNNNNTILSLLTGL